MIVDSSGPLRKTTACPSDSTCSRIGEGTINRPFSSTLHRYSPANINGPYPLRCQCGSGAIANPLFQIRTYEAPFFSKFEGGNLATPQVTIECALGDLEIAACLLRCHQLALGLFGHCRTWFDRDPYASRGF